MQNILFIVGINHDKAASRLIMVTQEPSLDKINYLRADFLVPVLSANTQPPNQHSRVITSLLDPRNKFHKSPLCIIRQLRNSNRRIRQRKDCRNITFQSRQETIRTPQQLGIVVKSIFLKKSVKVFVAAIKDRKFSGKFLVIATKKKIFF